MSNLTVEYTGENTATQGLVTTPLQAAHQIMNGYIPANLKDLSVGNSNFRDATIGYVLRDAVNQDLALGALCSALRSATDLVAIRHASEYVASVAYSWGHSKLALQAITRNEPINATPFIWSVAQAMSKQMPGPFYMTLLVSQLNQAQESWEQSTR
jgi:hypothetical protein